MVDERRNVRDNWSLQQVERTIPLYEWILLNKSDHLKYIIRKKNTIREALVTNWDEVRHIIASGLPPI